MKKLIGVAFAFLFTVMPISLAKSESCNTDCHGQCRIRTDFPPVSFIEPTCHAKCEVAKKAACAIGSSIPTIPITPREQFEVGANAVCGSVFYGITNSVIASCSNEDGRLDGQHLINNARAILVQAGLFQDAEFNGIQIRFCSAIRGEGIAPERGRIYLSRSMMNGSLVALASLLGHEMVHVRQHRRMGTERFACDYSRQFVECGNCQDSRHSMEREAYDWQTANAGRIAGASFPVGPGPAPAPPPFPPQSRIATQCAISPMQWCWMSVPIAVGSSCFCPTPYGPMGGVAR